MKDLVVAENVNVIDNNFPINIYVRNDVVFFVPVRPHLGVGMMTASAISRVGALFGLLGMLVITVPIASITGKKQRRLINEQLETLRALDINQIMDLEGTAVKTKDLVFNEIKKGVEVICGDKKFLLSNDDVTSLYQMIKSGQSR